MSRLLPLALLAAAVVPVPASVTAQAIPERPEDLRFPPSVFEPPPVSGLRFELGNGLPVYVVPDRSLPLVDVVLALPVGDRNEGPGEDGLASMTAAMARRGGAGEFGPEELDDEIDALGARIEASSSWERTVLVLDSGSESVDRGLELLASVLFEPRFDGARLAQAKENLRVSLLAETDDPRAVLEREWLRLVHGPGSPRSRRLTEASVAAFDRDALARFHRRHWSSQGAVIAASGDVDPEALVARLDELFGGWAPPPAEAERGSEGPAARVARRVRRGRGVSRRRRVRRRFAGLVDDRSTRPASGGRVRPPWRDLRLLGRPRPLGPDAADRDPGRPGRGVPAALAAAARGGAHLPRPDLLRSRRRRRRGGFRAQSRHGGVRVFLETAPEAAVAAAAVVLEELRRLLRDEVPENEIATARQSLLARLPLLFDRAEAIAGRYAEDELLGRPHEYWAVYRERLLAVTAADVRGAARRFLDPEVSVLLVVGGRKAVSRDRGFDELRDVLGDPRPGPG